MVKAQIDLKDSILKEISKRLGIDYKETLKYIRDTPDPVMGDIALEIAFALAKKNQRPVSEEAEATAKKIEGTEYIEKINVDSGHINIFYDYRNISGYLLDKVDGEYGRVSIGKKERVIVEHTSVNPNKAIHIGHAKNAALGDSISRLLRFAGYDVIVTNYIDDTGSQVADNIVGIKFLGFPMEKPGVKIDHYIGDEVYVEVNRMYEEKPELLKHREEVLKMLEKGNNDISSFSSMLIKKILDAHAETMDRLRVKYDLLNYESHILAFKFWETAFSQLKKEGLIKLEESGEKKGCWVFRSKIDGSEKIIVRSNGTVVYVGKDIAYAMWKHGMLKTDFNYKVARHYASGGTEWTTTLEDGVQAHPKFNDVGMSVNVVDVRQSYEQNVVKEVIEQLKPGARYMHYSYEVVALSDNTVKALGESGSNRRFTHMSGRKGIYVNVDDVLDVLSDKIYSSAVERNKDRKDMDLRKFADSAAASTLRYELIRSDKNKITLFDIEGSLNLENRTAMYFLYTYARANSILAKSGLDHASTPDYRKLETNQYEKSLIKDMLDFPDVIKRSASSLDLVVLSNFSQKLASDFNSFYEHVEVNGSEDGLRAFRLRLVKASLNLLSNCMQILGIDPFERI